MALLCLCPLFVAAQNYEQQGDELFAQAQYEKAEKKYKAAIEISGASSSLQSKKEKCSQCAKLLQQAISAEESSNYATASKAYADLFSIHALPNYKSKANALKQKADAKKREQERIKQEANLREQQRREAEAKAEQERKERLAEQEKERIAREKADTYIPKGTGMIKEGAFQNRKDIIYITIPSSVTFIAANAFKGCKNLKSITIPDGVTDICPSAFQECQNLTSVIIPNSVLRIGESAFAGCIRLTSVTVPDNVRYIGDFAFSAVPNVIYRGSWKGDFGGRFRNGYVEGIFVYSNSSKTKLVACSATAKGTVRIPNSVIFIEKDAFRACDKITSIEISNTVTRIGRCAFEYCENLSSISIPNSVTSIEGHAFASCCVLTSIDIPNSVTSIGNFTFFRCSNLTSVTIGEGVTNIGERAFISCSKIASITCKASTPPTCGSSVFENVSTSIPVYVPAASINAYKNAKCWKDFTNIQAINE